MKALDPIRSQVKSVYRYFARTLDTLSGGKITPDHVTVAGTILHGVIAVLILQEQFIWAGFALIVIGLTDTLDGELSRLQGRSSDFGVVIDAVFDRIKEVMLYTSLVYVFARNSDTTMVAWTTIAVGLSLVVTYIKAKGEAVTAVHNSRTRARDLNRLFGQDSLMRFEIRMAVLVFGLISGFLNQSIIIIAVASAISMWSRMQELRTSL